MSASPADPAGKKALRLVAAGLFSVAALPAFAQEPVRLTPIEPMPQALRPAEMDDLRPGQPSTAPVPQGPRAPDGIEVRELKPSTIESVGVLDANTGGFGRDMWVGTPAMVVRKLVPMIPGANGSPVLRDLARRLLLTAATAPEGADFAAAGGGPTLVGLRAERLLALGDVDGMAALAATTPGAANRPLLGRLIVDGLLASGKTEQACANVAGALSAGYDSSLARTQVYCHYAAGRTLEGNLALDLLREGKAVDSAFVAAAEALAGLPPVPSDKLSLPQPEPQHVALFAAARQALPKDAVANASPAVLSAMIGAEGLPEEQRLEAAERAEALGIVSADTVRKLYAQVPATPAELTAAIPTAEQGGPRAMMVLYRAASDMSDEGVRAQIVGKALELGKAQGRFTSVARIFEPMLGTIRPAPENTALAEMAARAMFAAGRHAAAVKWLDLDSRAKARMWPLAAIAYAGGGHGVDVTGYAGWRAAQEGEAPEVFARRAALALGVLSGLGGRIPDAAWLDAYGPAAEGPSPALFGLMQSGALDARTGITVLASLAAIGDAPLDKAPALALSEAVSALTVVGLGDEARRLAVDVLIANGI